MTKKERNSVLKKLKEKEEKLLDIIDEIESIFIDTDDEELYQMVESWKESILDFHESNDTMTLNDIREFIETEE
jgi:hypothetical protein